MKLRLFLLKLFCNLFFNLFFNKNKRAQSLPIVRIIVIFLGVVVLLVMTAGPAGQLIPFLNSSQMDGLEATCTNYQEFSRTQVVYCETRNDAALPETSRYNCALDSIELERFPMVEAYVQSKGCEEIGGEGCTCLTNAFILQRNDAFNQIDGEDSRQTGGSTIGGIITGEIREEQSIDFSIFGYSFDDLSSLFSSRDEQEAPVTESQGLINVHTRIDSYVPLDLTGVERVLRRGGHFERMQGYLSHFDSAAQEFDINPYYLLAHFILETGHGQSRIWRDKNNGFGIGAHDRAPYDLAFTYDSQEEGIREGARFIAERYIHNQGTHSGEQGPRNTLHKMNFRDSGEIFYASDREWAQKIATIANNFIIESDSYQELLRRGVDRDFSSTVNHPPTTGTIFSDQGIIEPRMATNLRPAEVSRPEYAPFIRYENRGTRSWGLAEDLERILAQTASEVGVVVIVTSGGQPATGSQRTGSNRHNFGNGADFDLLYNNQRITIAHQKYQEFIQLAFRNGIRTGSMGPRYMGNGRMHLDITTKCSFWGWEGNEPSATFVQLAKAGIRERGGTVVDCNSCGSVCRRTS